MLRSAAAAAILFVLSSAAWAGPSAPATRPVDFRTDVIAALSHAGCNAGACHGSPQGKNGFRLSLRGFDPDLDYQSLVRDGAGRRTDREAPDDSLILLKGAGRTAHQGGVRFRRGDVVDRVLRTWIAEGCRDSIVPEELVRLEVLPDHLRLPTDAPRQQIVARAAFFDRRSPRRDRLVGLHLQQSRRRDGNARRPGRISADRRGRYSGALPRPDRRAPASPTSAPTRNSPSPRRRRPITSMNTCSPGSATCN